MTSNLINLIGGQIMNSAYGYANTTGNVVSIDYDSLYAKATQNAYAPKQPQADNRRLKLLLLA